MSLIPAPKPSQHPTESPSSLEALPDSREPITKREIRRKVLDLAWPTLTEMFLSNLIVMLNMIMVSRVSAEAVAGVALTSQPILFCGMLFAAMNIGSIVIVARAIGAGNSEEANRSAQTSFNVNILFILPIVLFGMLFASNILRWMGATPEVVEGAAGYARLAFLAFAFTILSNSVSSVLRGAGDTKTSAKINVTADVLIVAIGVPLIYGWFGLPQLGLLGAGIATLIARVLAAAWMLKGAFSGRKKIILRISLIGQIDKNLVRRILKIGLPGATETFVMRVGQIFLTILIAGLGTQVFAANQIAFNILGLTIMPALALSHAATTLVGQGLGAKKPQQAEQLAWETNKLGMVFSGVVGIGFIVFPQWILMLYTNDQEVIRLGSIAMQVIGWTQVFQAAQFVLSGALRGAGDTKFSLKITFIGVWGIRIVLTLIFVYIFDWGLLGAWLAIAVDQVYRTLFLILRFRRGDWKTIKV